MTINSMISDFEEKHFGNQNIEPICNTRKRCETILSKYLLVRILIDIPIFVGHDLRNYKLNKGDIATIPKVNANVLIKRKVAIEIKSR